MVYQKIISLTYVLYYRTAEQNRGQIHHSFNNISFTVQKFFSPVNGHWFLGHSVTGDRNATNYDGNVTWSYDVTSPGVESNKRVNSNGTIIGR